MGVGSINNVNEKTKKDILNRNWRQLLLHTHTHTEMLHEERYCVVVVGLCRVALLSKLNRKPNDDDDNLE